MYIQVVVPLKLPFHPTYHSPSAVTIGEYVEVALSGHLYAAIVVAVDVTPAKPSSIKPIERVLSDIPSEEPSTLIFWQQMADYYMCTLGEVFKAARPVSRLEDILKDAERNRQKASNDAFKRQLKLSKLIDKHIALELRETKKEQQLERAKEATRAKYEAELAKIRADKDAVRMEMDSLKGKRREDAPLPPVTVPEQDYPESEAAHLGTLLGAKPLLWEGVPLQVRMDTYAELAAKRLADGESTLILLPESFRTEAMHEALKGFLPDVVFWDGGLTAAQERSVLGRIRDGRPYVMAGTRSALLLPHYGLGLIIVDDEQDVSYKQDSPAPRYNTRDMAVMLAAREGIPVLLSSEAPSMETILNVKAGKYSRESWSGGRGRCLVIDTFKELRKRGMEDVVSRKLLNELSRAITAGYKGILMVPGKAYAPFLKCEACKEPVRCPDCDGYVSVRKNIHGGLAAWCATCQKVVPVTGTCQCGGQLTPSGAGLGKLVEIVRRFFPELRVGTIDGDMGEKGQAAVLDSFAKGTFDVLVGTQVVQKAFSCGDIGFIGVLEADRWFAGDDFRADEKALRLFRRLQGMTCEGGILVLQTRDGERPVFQAVDTESFLYLEDEPSEPIEERMLRERSLAGLPPFTRMVDIRVTDANAVRLDALSRALAGTLPDGMRLMGPFLKEGREEEGRMHIHAFLPKGRSLADRKAALKEAVDAFVKERKYVGHVSIDVDPV